MSANDDDKTPSTIPPDTRIDEKGEQPQIRQETYVDDVAGKHIPSEVAAPPPTKSWTVSEIEKTIGNSVLNFRNKKLQQFGLDLNRKNDFRLRDFTTRLNAQGRRDFQRELKTGSDPQKLRFYDIQAHTFRTISANAALSSYQFQKNAQLPYMRKSLALSYKKVELLKRVATGIETFTQIVSNKLEAIKMNTAKAAPKKKSYFGDIYDKVKDKNKDRIATNISNVINDQYDETYSKYVSPAMSRLHDIMSNSDGAKGGVNGVKNAVTTKLNKIRKSLQKRSQMETDSFLGRAQSKASEAGASILGRVVKLGHGRGLGEGTNKFLSGQLTSWTDMLDRLHPFGRPNVNYKQQSDGTTQELVNTPEYDSESYLGKIFKAFENWRKDYKHDQETLLDHVSAIRHTIAPGGTSPLSPRGGPGGSGPTSGGGDYDQHRAAAGSRQDPIWNHPPQPSLFDSLKHNFSKMSEEAQSSFKDKMKSVPNVGDLLEKMKLTPQQKKSLLATAGAGSLHFDNAKNTITSHPKYDAFQKKIDDMKGTIEGVKETLPDREYMRKFMSDPEERQRQIDKHKDALTDHIDAIKHHETISDLKKKASDKMPDRNFFTKMFSGLSENLSKPMRQIETYADSILRILKERQHKEDTDHPHVRENSYDWFKAKREAKKGKSPWGDSDTDHAPGDMPHTGQNQIGQAAKKGAGHVKSFVKRLFHTGEEVVEFEAAEELAQLAKKGLGRRMVGGAAKMAGKTALGTAKLGGKALLGTGKLGWKAGKSLLGGRKAATATEPKRSMIGRMTDAALGKKPLFQKIADKSLGEAATSGGSKLWDVAKGAGELALSAGTGGLKLAGKTAGLAIKGTTSALGLGVRGVTEGLPWLAKTGVPALAKATPGLARGALGLAKSPLGVGIAGMVGKYFVDKYTTGTTKRIGDSVADAAQFGSIGFMLGGPVGAAIGAAVGVIYDNTDLIGQGLHKVGQGVHAVASTALHAGEHLWTTLFGQAPMVEKNGHVSQKQQLSLLSNIRDSIFGRDAKYSKSGELILAGKKSIFKGFLDGFKKTKIGSEISSGVNNLTNNIKSTASSAINSVETGAKNIASSVSSGASAAASWISNTASSAASAVGSAVEGVSKYIGGKIGSIGDMLTKIIGYEGGSKVVVDDGGTTKYGISQNAFPGENIRGLTEDRARQLYMQKYVAPLGLDKMPPAAGFIALDMAVNSGVGAAKKMIATTGGDPAKMIDYRRNFFQSLATKNPSKYGKYLKGWLNRLDKVAKDAGVMTSTAGGAAATGGVAGAASAAAGAASTKATGTTASAAGGAAKTATQAPSATTSPAATPKTMGTTASDFTSRSTASAQPKPTVSKSAAAASLSLFGDDSAFTGAANDMALGNYDTMGKNAAAPATKASTTPDLRPTAQTPAKSTQTTQSPTPTTPATADAMGGASKAIMKLIDELSKNTSALAGNTTALTQTGAQKTNAKAPQTNPIVPIITNLLGGNNTTQDNPITMSMRKGQMAAGMMT